MLNPYVPRPIDMFTEVPLAAGTDLSELDEIKTFAAPDDPADWPAWRAVLTSWRAAAKHKLDYQGTRYDTEPGGRFVFAVTWLWDELLYDHDLQRFTVSKYLAHAEREFGGFDGVLLWHAYPAQGIDDRDQYSYYRDIGELPAVIRELQDAGLHVQVTIYPWESSQAADITGLVEWTGADGVFFDSVREGSRQAREALDELRPGISMEAESRLASARLEDHTMSWAQWYADSPVPGVLRAKWFERRHMQHHVRRWNRGHIDELHSAWINGVGVMIWESVFGVWVGWSARDKSVLRAMRVVQRDWAPWLRSERWTPLADHPGNDCPVYASRWEHDGVPLWTLVNRSEQPYDGVLLDAAAGPGLSYTELTAGSELTITEDGGRTQVSGRLPAGGVAAIVATPPGRRPAPCAVTHEDDASFPARSAERVTMPPPPKAAEPGPGAVTVPAGRHELRVRYRVRETGLYGEAPYVDEWKPLPPRLHHTGTLYRTVHLHGAAVERAEVTNAQYARFLAATGYRPLRTERFLAHWDGGQPAPGTGDQPVSHVDLADARAYAAWNRMRLPTEDEWQLAAETGLLRRGSPVVWNLTDSEHTDGRTRFCILKGGSGFVRGGSDWYIDGGPQPPECSVKYLLTGAGLFRSPWIGFRCATGLTE